MQIEQKDKYWLTIEDEEEEEESTELDDDNSDDLDAETDNDEESDDGSDETDGDGAEDESDEVEVSFGEPADKKPEDEEQDTGLVRHLRKTIREQNRRLKEIEAKTNAPAIAQISQLPKKPALSDFDYDEDKYADAMDQWHETKREIETKKREIEQEQENSKKAFQQKIETYNERKTQLRVKGFDDAEDNVRDSLTELQQGALVQLSEKPELLVYALGKDSAQLKRLSEIKDPAQFIWELAKLETKLTTRGKDKPATSPEKTVKGSGTLSASTDKTLDALRAQAEKTGDYTKVIQYKQSKRGK